MKTLLIAFLTVFSLHIAAHAQIITTVAGNGVNTYAGDGGAATDASLYNPLGVAADAAGNVYISDTKNHCIRKVNTSGIVTTIAGTGVAGDTGDGGPATAAQLYIPSKIALDDAGNIYVVDNGNFRIRRINTVGTITTIAGNGTAGNTGDGGMAAAAQINACPGLAIDAANNIYFSDVTKHTIRKISKAGVITTIAGSGVPGYTGDGGPATAAKLSEPFGIDIDNAGNLYIAEYNNNCIRKVSASGIISTLTGFITTGYSGDGGPATAAQLNRPFDVVADVYHNLYIADHNNHVIRKIAANGIITTIVGNGMSGYSGDGDHATAAQLSAPTDVVLDFSGNLVLAVSGNHRVRKITNVVVVKDISVIQPAEVKIYPNPTAGIFTMQVVSAVDEEVSILVTDLLGRIILEIKDRTNRPVVLNLDIPTGMYMLSANINGTTVSQKITIIRQP